MQVKLFNTRLEAEYVVADQQALNAFLNTVTVKNTSTQFVNGNPDYWSILVFYENGENEKLNEEVMVATPKPKPAKKEKAKEEPTQPVETVETELSEEEQQIALALRTWRKDKSNELQQPEFMIFPNATLNALAKGKPRSMNDLEKIKGMGPAKITRYGDDLMAILNAF